MGPSVEQVRDFVLQVEKSLAARRLYNANSTPYRDANERVVERCRAALGAEGFTIRFGATDLFLDKQSLINRPKHEDSFFFPLYRDGLRELTFTTETSPQDVTALLGVFETKDQQLGPADDMVNHLWRCDLTTITHNAIDGIGDVEEDASDGKDDFRALVADLAEKIKRPAAAETGQTYSFMLDADVQVAAQDFHYDATTVRRTFDENPAVLQITGEQANELRAEFNANRDQALLERFIEILLITIRLPFKSIDPAAIGPVLAQLAEGYWSSHEIERMVILLTHIRTASQEAPNPDARAAMSDVLKRVIGDERQVAIMSEFVGGRISIPLATKLWEIAPEAQIWPLLLDAWSKLVEGEQRTAIATALRKRLASNVELLAGTLASPEPGRVRAALALLDERTEKLFAKQLITLATHPEESIRLKGLAAAAKFGGTAAVDTLWKAMESDPSKSVRLFAFRAISSSKPAGLAPRLQTLVTSAQFAERPVWEREKYIRLLGTVGGAAVEPLFESWIPSKRWMWQAKDLETLELALRGLGATGDSGYEKVRKIAESGGKPGEVARKVLDSISRCEIGENTVMRPEPEKS